MGREEKRKGKERRGGDERLHTEIFCLLVSHLKCPEQPDPDPSKAGSQQHLRGTPTLEPSSARFPGWASA